MSNATDFLENLTINRLLRAQAFTPYANVYLGLLTAISNGETGAVTEVTGGGYARQECALDAAASSATSNTSDEQFTNMPATAGTSTTVIGWGLWNDSIAGNLLLYGTLPSPKTYQPGRTALIEAGLLDILLTGDGTTFFNNLAINHMLRGQAHTPTTTYTGLYTTATDAAGGGVEVSTGGGSYLRQVATFSAATTGTTSNSIAIQFVNMPAIGSPGVVNWALLDASSGGNMLIHKTLTAAQTFTGGETARIPVNALSVSVF